MATIDDKIIFWINGFVGKSAALDRVMIWLASDYFIPVTMALMLLALWFCSGDAIQRDKYHRGIIVAAVSMGSVCGFVLAVSHLNWHWHPWQEHTDTLLPATLKIFYPIHDPPFPSNTSSVTFAAAAAIWQRSRKVGLLFLIPAVLMPLAKLYAAVYYPSDVVGGAILGILTAYFIKLIMPVFEPIISRVLLTLRWLSLA